MKRTDNHGMEWREHRRSQGELTADDSVQGAVARMKETMLYEYAHLAGEHTRLLRLALNEAEALAAETGFSHLLFPVLATEKANAAIAWHERQSTLRRSSLERAVVE